MTEPEENLEEGKSKSQLKREATALQELGEELVALPASSLKKIPLDERLKDAIGAARAMPQRGARKRQLQYIGRLMRAVDAEPIQRAMDLLKGQDKAAAAHFQRLERLRDRLVEEGDETLADLLDQFPGADRQRLRQLVRNARKEKESGKPVGSGRALFRYLRELEEEHSA
jgi:ribosome-associated protein